MTKTEFRNLYSCYKLADFLTTQSTNQVKNILKTFVCTRNADVEDFLRNKAITFEKYLRSRTYLYINNQNKKIKAYFSIGITYLLTKQLDRDMVRFLDGYTYKSVAIPCYLVGQLGKSDECKIKIGNFLLDEAISIIDSAQSTLGGRFVLVDSLNNERVIKFYEKNSFLPLERDSFAKSIKMIKPYFSC